MGAELSKQVFDSSTSVADLKWDASLRTSELLQEIINNKNKITSPLIAAKVGWCFAAFAMTDEGRKMTTTNAVYDVIINHCAKRATTAESVRHVGHAIGNITGNNPDGKRLFSTPETAFALNNALQKYATTVGSVQRVGGAILHICLNNSHGQRLFSTPETVAAFNNALQKYATSDESVENLSKVVHNMCFNNPAGLKLFATNDFISALKNVEKYATTASSKTHLNNCLKLLQDYLKQNPQQKNNNINQSGAAVASPIQKNNNNTSKAATANVQNQQQNSNNRNNNQSNSSTSVVVRDESTPFPPGALVFHRGVPACDWKEAVERAMSLRELPRDDDGNILRPDLKDYIPDDHYLEAVLRFAENELAALKDRDEVKALIAKCGLTDDDIRALWIYKAQHPYPLYKWINAWLMSSRRDDKVKQSIGPLRQNLPRDGEAAENQVPGVSRSARSGHPRAR
jgi:hypothetical protein